MADFRYVNLTPDGSHTDNCVNRAIANGSGLTYEEVEYKLELIGELLDCDYRCVCCYEFLLTHYFGFEPIRCRGLTLDEFAEEHPYGLYLVRSEGHISVLDDYEVQDIWDCRDMVLTNAWRIKR